MTRRIVDREGWLAAAHGGRLVALWGAERGADGFAVSAAYATPRGLDWVELPLGHADTYPDLSFRFPYASRMQRAARDLVGLSAEGMDDGRPWLDHGAWTRRWPLREKPVEMPQRDPSDYAFVRVEGEGVHEIPVGPVHAGMIGPGHFRFSVVGETVLLSCGYASHWAQEAEQALTADGVPIPWRHIAHVCEAVLAQWIASQPRLRGIVVLEDHGPAGGLADTVRRIAPPGVTVRALSWPSGWYGESGAIADLRRAHGLDTGALVRRIKEYMT